MRFLVPLGAGLTVAGLGSLLPGAGGWWATLLAGGIASLPLYQWWFLRPGREGATSREPSPAGPSDGPVPEATEEGKAELRDAPLEPIATRLGQVASSLEKASPVHGVLQSHLGSVVRETEKAATDIVTKVQAIDGHVASFVERLRVGIAAGDQGDSSKILDRSLESLSELRSKVRQREEAGARGGRLIEAILDDAQRTRGVLEDIGRIARQTRIVAVNAAIEASRHGDQQNGFRVIAREVQQLAEHTRHAVADVEQSVRTLVRGIEEGIGRELEAQHRQGRIEAQQIDRISTALEERVRAFRHLDEGRKGLLLQATTDAERLSLMILELLAGIQFQDVTRQRIEQVVETLGQLGEQLAAVTSWLHAPEGEPEPTLDVDPERLVASYVMDSQRRDHLAAVSDHGAGEPEPPEAEEAGLPTIELF